MDRQIDVSVQRKRTGKRLLYLILTICGILLAIIGVRKLLNRPLKLSDLITATVKQGDIENTISATGFIKPSSEVLLTSPISARIQSVHLEKGASVEIGTPILQLDTEFANLQYQRLRDESRLKTNNVTRLKLTLEKNIRDIELDDSIKNMQVQNYMALLTDAKRLKEIGGATEEEVEQASQNLKIAQLEKQKLENELNYRRASFTSDVENEKIQSSIQENTLLELGKKIRLAKVSAPASGVITWLNNNIGTQVDEGSPLVRIANLSSYSIDATASDIHAQKIKTGMLTYVRIGDENIKGRIEQILPAVENNTVQFRIQLENPTYEKLRPNMQVDVRVVTGKKENTVYVANGPAFDGSKTQKIFVIQQNTAIAREVQVGMTSTEKLEILAGLSTGENIIISDMSAHANRTQIKLK